VTIRAILLFGGAVQGDDTTAPAYSSAEEGDVTNPTVAVLFSENIVSPGADYAAGVTIKVNTVAATISSATRQVNKRWVYYVLASTPDANDGITWEYAAASGDLEDEAGNALEDVAAETVTNNIGRHLRFNDAPNSMHLVTVGL
jgi:hypothetical protein